MRFSASWGGVCSSTVVVDGRGGGWTDDENTNMSSTLSPVTKDKRYFVIVIDLGVCVRFFYMGCLIYGGYCMGS